MYTRTLRHSCKDSTTVCTVHRSSSTCIPMIQYLSFRVCRTIIVCKDQSKIWYVACKLTMTHTHKKNKIRLFCIINTSNYVYTSSHSYMYMYKAFTVAVQRSSSTRSAWAPPSLKGPMIHYLNFSVCRIIIKCKDQSQVCILSLAFSMCREGPWGRLLLLTSMVLSIMLMSILHIPHYYVYPVGYEMEMLSCNDK